MQRAALIRPGALCGLLLWAGSLAMSVSAEPPVRLTWSLGPAMPQYRKGGVLGTVGGKVIYTAGMQHPWREPEESLVFDPTTGAWSATAPLPIGPSYTSGTSTGDALYVVSGRNAEGRCFRLTGDGAQWTWTELPRLRQPRVFAAVAVVGDWLIAAGGGWGMMYGAFDPTPVSTVEGLDLAHTDRGWQELPHYPGIDRPGVFGAACAGRLYMFGGYRCMQDGMQAPDGFIARNLCPRLADAYSYDPATRQWTRLADLPTELSGGSAVTIADRYIVLLGGSHMSAEASRFSFEGETVGGYNDRVYVYDTRDDTYHVLADPLPAGVNDIRACTLGNSIYAAGGESIDKRTSNTVNLLQVARIALTGK